MPRVPARLSLNPASNYQPNVSSGLTVPPSPTSPRTPLQPPAKLHLRSVLPSPRLYPEFLQNHPEDPCPWIWRCHICSSVYRLGVTRRCLEDGHFFCALPSPINTPTPSPPSSSSSSSSDYKARQEEAARASARRKRKRKQIRGCRAEFDYAGWALYNIWRCEINNLRNGPSPPPPPTSSKLDFVQNCWADCGFPSECHNARLERLRTERMRRAAGESLNLAQEWEAIRVQMEAAVQAEEFFKDGDAISPASPSEEEAVLQVERRGLEDEAKLVDVSPGKLKESIELDEEEKAWDDVGMDEVGEREVEFVERRRKKSVLKIQQLMGLMLGTQVAGPTTEPQPSSPLKQEFWVEDLQDDEEEEEEEMDPQMREMLRTRDDMLRKLEKGDSSVF